MPVIGDVQPTMVPAVDVPNRLRINSLRVLDSRASLPRKRFGTATTLVRITLVTCLIFWDAIGRAVVQHFATTEE
jgi:hypothetical protein